VGGDGRELRPRGRWGASARTHHVRADASVLPQVTSKKTLQCVQVTDAPAAIFRPSIRKRPRDNPGGSGAPFPLVHPECPIQARPT
jgi:hypothetical protein